jgi:hypothetical protein
METRSRPRSARWSPTRARSASSTRAGAWGASSRRPYRRGRQAYDGRQYRRSVPGARQAQDHDPRPRERADDSQRRQRPGYRAGHRPGHPPGRGRGQALRRPLQRGPPGERQGPHRPQERRLVQDLHQPRSGKSFQMSFESPGCVLIQPSEGAVVPRIPTRARETMEAGSARSSAAISPSASQPISK